jgi:hypothetical protein
MRDLRNIYTGHEIPSENYCDQPYVVITKDGNWLCVLTTGPGLESRAGQHVVAAISEDHGATWSDLIDIESSEAQMSSWVTAVRVPYGRVYSFYNYNQDGGSTQHGGWFCYRYSDDNGRTWSDKRYRVPMRMTKRDRQNVSGGKHQYFWCIDKPVIVEDSVYLSLPKLYSGVPLDGGEGWVVHSDNLASETDPEKLHWEMLPDGEVGVVNPDLGTVQEEQNLEVLSDGTLYMVYRTQIGYIGYATSKDGGHTWTEPVPLTYANGKRIKNPRACPKIWKADNGNFVLWFHNNGFPGWGNSANRNPVWLTGGVEVDGDIQWSDPEILLYDPDPTIRGMSYPDFIEQDGHYWVTETQKMTAYVHEIDPTLLEGLWKQRTAASVAQEGLVLQVDTDLSAADSFEIPQLPSLADGGFTLELWVELDSMAEGQTLLSSFGKRRRGFQVSTAPDGTLKLSLHDGQSRRWLEVVDGPEPSQNVRSVSPWYWKTDPGTIQAGKLHHVVFIVDGLANIVSVTVDGVLCDGACSSIQGWWRLNPHIHEINDEGLCHVGENFQGQIHRVRLYDRYLRTSQAIANWRAGL